MHLEILLRCISSLEKMLKIRLIDKGPSSWMTCLRLWVLEMFKIELGFCTWLQIEWKKSTFRYTVSVSDCPWVKVLLPSPPQNRRPPHA